MKNYAKFMDLLGPSRLKEMIFTGRLLGADEALAAGFVHEIVPAADIEKRVREVADKVASHAPLTLQVTKEAVRRLQEARPVPDGDDLVRKIYGSADFREGVRAFVDKRPPRWTGK
jgi:enoyl-CoA hydratase/carnithine racemase